MAATVTRLHQSDAAKLLSDFANRIQDKEITDLIFYARDKDGITTSHWFGHDSALRCLGMAQYMSWKIGAYIDNEDFEV
jgi:hypothetical protein